MALDLLMLCFSINVSIVGQMFNTIKTIYQIDYSQASFLLSIQSVGGLVLAFASIFLIDVLNKTKVLLICGFMLSTFLLLIGATPPLFLLFIIFIILGFSGGAINTLTSPVMIETVPARPERYINFLHMVFSLGAVITPLASQFIFSLYGLSGVFIIFGVFMLICAFYAGTIFRYKIGNNRFAKKVMLKNNVEKVLKTLRIKEIQHIFITAVLVTSWQLSAIYYISSYVKEINENNMQGALALSILFFGMMVSRLIFSKYADRFEPKKVLIISNLIGAFVWLTFFFIQLMPIKLILIGISAACCANNFPILFSKACKTAPENMAAASGVVTLGYYVAIFIFIPLIGTLGERMGMERALPLISLFLILILPFANKMSLKKS